MEYTFSERVSTLRPSAIREILKYSAVPGMISFAAGNPAPEAFPAEQLAQISARLYEERPVDLLQYSVTEGYTPLREAIKNRYPQYFKEHDDIIITSGAQQVMELSAKVLCNEGDTIILEEPVFIGTLNSFRSINANLVGVPMESDGMNVQLLEKALKENSNTRFIYCIPNFQNPTGAVTSFAKRKAIYELARKYNVMILEDDPYGETRFFGAPIDSIKSLDADGRVIYAGTFSKVIAPGIRVGYAIAPKPIISKLTVCKQVSDVHTSINNQILVHEFITSEAYDEHIASLAPIYRKKSGIMTALLDIELAPRVEYIQPTGGLFIWCTLPDQIDMPEFCKEAVARGVAVVPGNAFLIDENAPCSCIRLNYSTPTDEQIEEGVKILGELLLDY